MCHRSFLSSDGWCSGTLLSSDPSCGRTFFSSHIRVVDNEQITRDITSKDICCSANGLADKKGSLLLKSVAAQFREPYRIANSQDHKGRIFQSFINQLNAEGIRFQRRVLHVAFFNDTRTSYTLMTGDNLRRKLRKWMNGFCLEEVDARAQDNQASELNSRSSLMTSTLASPSASSTTHYDRSMVPSEPARSSLRLRSSENQVVSNRQLESNESAVSDKSDNDSEASATDPPWDYTSSSD